MKRIMSSLRLLKLACGMCFVSAEPSGSTSAGKNDQCPSGPDNLPANSFSLILCFKHSRQAFIGFLYSNNIGKLYASFLKIYQGSGKGVSVCGR